MRYLEFYPGGFILSLPWVWIDLSIYASGGINIEFSDPNDIRGLGPTILGYIEFYPHRITIFDWWCPQHPHQWRNRLRLWKYDIKNALHISRN